MESVGDVLEGHPSRFSIPRPGPADCAKDPDSCGLLSRRNLSVKRN